LAEVEYRILRTEHDDPELDGNDRAVVETSNLMPRRGMVMGVELSGHVLIGRVRVSGYGFRLSGLGALLLTVEARSLGVVVGLAHSDDQGSPTDGR
jgi:hypothetical protein